MADPQVTTATQELLFGIGSQVLVLDAPEPLQSVNSVTVRELVNDDTAPAEDATQGSAAVAANPRSITAAAGYGQANRRTITVANSSNVVTGQRWVIAADAETRWETFEVVNVETTTITARHPILNDYASGDTISCLRWTIAVRDAWAADLTNLSPNLNPNPRYRVAWDVTLADAPSTRRIYETNFDLVRHAAVCPVNPIDVVEAFGGWLDLLGPDDRATQGREVIAEATRLVHHIGTRLQVQMVGIGQQRLRTKRFHGLGQDTLDRRRRADGNECRGLDITVRGVDHPGPAAPVRQSRGDLEELLTHRSIQSIPRAATQVRSFLSIFC